MTETKDKPPADWGAHKDATRTHIKEVLKRRGAQYTAFQRHVILTVFYWGFIELNDLARSVYGNDFDAQPDRRGGRVAACNRAVRACPLLRRYRTQGGDTVAFAASDSYIFKRLLPDGEDVKPEADN